MEFLALGLWLLSVIILDILWVSLLRKYVISNDIKLLLALKVNPLAAVLTWIFLVIGCYWFVVIPTQWYTLPLVFAYGAFFGLIVYGIYEFTNKALLFAWNWKLVVWDIVWGMVLCGSVSVVMGYSLLLV